MALPPIRINSLPAATLPLEGTENAAVVQGGVTKKAPSGAIANALPNVTAVVSDPVAVPDVDPGATYVEITSSGSGGAEFVNILPSPVNDERYIGRRMLVALKTQTNPADVVHITGIETITLQSVNKPDFVQSVIADLSFNTETFYAILVNRAGVWLVDADNYQNNIDLTGVGVSYQPVGVTSAGDGNELQLEGGNNFGAGNGGDVFIKGGLSTGGGINGGVIIGSSRVIMDNLNTADPGEFGALWIDPITGVLKVSGFP